MFKALEVQTVKTEAAKNRAKVVAHVMKDGLVNPPIGEESDVVVSKDENIPAATSQSENFSKMMKVRKIISFGFSVGHSMNMPNLLTGNSSNSSITSRR